jgi:prophage tail gpP-like protein
MPKATEVCEVAAGGKNYRDWTSVMVQREYGGFASAFTLTVAELSGKATGFSSIKLKPGDAVQIKLAGVKVIDGFIEIRQAVLSSQLHGVQVQGRSKTCDLVDCSADIKPGQFKNYSFEQITKSALKPFGLKFSWRNMPDGASKPFKSVQVFHGETAFEFIERLARLRGVFVTDDEHGNLVGGSVKSTAAPAATLEEGRNIFEARAMMRDDAVFSVIKGHAQDKGSDSVWGKGASQISATAENPTMKRYRPMILISEEPSTKEDLKDRVDREQAQRIGTAVQCSIVVQGWLKPGGKSLWKEGEILSVKSPSLFPNSSGSQRLAVQCVTYAQDAVRGTTTTLDLVLPQALGTKFPQGPGGGAPDLFSPGNEGAKPDA